MATGGPPTAPAAAGGPRTVPVPAAHSEAGKEKKDLASWWKTFKKSDKKAPEQVASPQGIFGVPLQTSIRYANVAISLFNDEGQSYIYGYVPIVVAKCGVFLKEKATDVEGIFRLAGSEKRIKELKVAFDSPDRYGKGLDWTGFTVHDAANILRRYFNQLPEPIIPLDFYQKFRDPLRNHQIQAVGSGDPAQTPSQGDFDPDAAIQAYQRLITELPPLNRQLLLYILDLLAVFASKSDLNKMTTPNLAAIFQPGILSHPQHDMAPQEYRLSQDVLIFLIENQDSFLIGMQGTAADAETVREVQSGSPSKAPSTPTTPNRSKTVIGRSSSNSSVAAESVRKWGSIRRNASVSSSKHSKRSDAGLAPATPTQIPSSGSVHRSNTVPSKRNDSTTQSPRFPREKGSDPTTPTPGTPGLTTGAAEASQARQNSLQSTPVATSAPEFPHAPPEVLSVSSSEATTPLAAVGSDTSSAVTRDFQTPKKDTTPLLASLSGKTDKSTDRSASSATPTSATERKFFNILKQSPGSDGEARKPNKLQKRRTPGSALSSAHSSSHSLPDTAQDASSRSPMSPPSAAINDQGVANVDSPASANLQGTPGSAIPQRNPTDATLKPTISPSHSFNSHTDVSDADLVGDDMPGQGSEPGQADKKQRRWRLSRPTNKIEPQQPTSGNPLGTMNTDEHATSRTTVGSGTSQPRKSFQDTAMLSSVGTDPTLAAPSQPQNPAIRSPSTDPVFSDSEREKKGLFSRIRDKIREGKDKDNEKRSRTPERGHDRSRSRQELQSLSDTPVAREKSTEPASIAAPEAAPASATTTLPQAVPAAEPLPQNHTPGVFAEHTTPNGDEKQEGSGGELKSVI